MPQARTAKLNLYDYDGKNPGQTGQVLSATGQKLSTKVIDMKSSKVFTFYDSQYTQANGSAMGSLQGACSDGTYIYALKTDGENDETRVVKIDPKTWTAVKTGPIINISHANDLTYNAKTGMLYSAWCSVDAKKYSIIDPNTLSVVETKSLTKGFFSIAYEGFSNRYVLAKSAQSENNFALMIYDGDFNYVSEFQTYRLGYTAQGIFCDAKYIYYAQSCQSSTGTTGSIITVFDWSGKIACVLSIDNSDEIESIFMIDGEFYACYNRRADLKLNDYIAKLTPAN